MISNENQITRLTTVLDLASSMIERAEADDWQRVIELEASRRHLLLAPLSPPENSEEAQTMAGLLRAILVTDDRLASLAGRARADAAQRLVRLREGKAGSTAYSDAAACTM